MNINTLNGYIGGTKRNQIPTLTLAAVTETALPLNTDTGTTSALLALPLQNAILGSSNGLGPNGNPAILVPPFGPGNNIPDGVNAPYFNSSSFDSARPFTLKLYGVATVVTNAANSLQFKIYQGTNTAIGSDTSFMSLTAFAAVTTGNLQFDINVRCQWDSTSQSLAGIVSGSWFYSVGSAKTIIASAATSVITTLATPSTLSFLPSVTFGNAAGGTVSVSEWSVEQN